MKKLLFTLLVFTTVFTSAQSTQFIYEYKFIKDSTKRSDIMKELMILNIGKDQSEYFSADKYAIDSALVEEVRQGKFAMPPNKDMIYDRVIKKVPSKNILYSTRIGGNKYEVAETVGYIWKIEPETDKILNHKVQRATTNNGGRKWTAWFSSEIPVNDGPYKFFGLPGLILKIEDEGKNHVMTLMAVKKMKNTFSYTEFNNYDRLYKTDFNRYRKIFKAYRNDPTADMIGKIPDQTDSEGNFRTGDQIIKEEKKGRLINLAKDNNIIEIDLLKN